MLPLYVWVPRADVHFARVFQGLLVFGGPISDACRRIIAHHTALRSVPKNAKDEPRKPKLHYGELPGSATAARMAPSGGSPRRPSWRLSVAWPHFPPSALSPLSPAWSFASVGPLALTQRKPKARSAVLSKRRTLTHVGASPWPGARVNVSTQVSRGSGGRISFPPWPTKLASGAKVRPGVQRHAAGRHPQVAFNAIANPAPPLPRP